MIVMPSILVTMVGLGTACRSILTESVSSQVHSVPNAQIGRQHETFITPSDRREQFAANAHGTNGILQVSLPATATVLDQRVLDTTEELKDEFPFNTDPNDGSVLGVGQLYCISHLVHCSHSYPTAWSQATIDGNNARSSAATAYLGPGYISRPNLHVLIGATATKLVQTDTVDDLPSFHKVEYKTDSQGATSSVSATKEIILSGGSINTPMLLMLSGIGDKDELKDLGISTVVNNPSVGKNLTDHPLLASVYSVQGTDSFDDVFRGDNLEKAIGEWMQNGTGALGDGVCNHLAFLRLPDNSSIFDGMEDPAAGPNAAHIEFIVSVC